MNSRIGNESKLLPIDGDARLFERLSYGVELIVGSENNILFLFRCQILRSSFQRQFEEPFFLYRISRNAELSLFVKHVGNAPAARQIPVVLGKDPSDFRGRSILVIGRSFQNHRYSAWRVTFVNDLLDLFDVGAFASSAFDRALDVVVRHTLRSGSFDHASKTRIAVGISAADARRDADFLRELAKDRAPFGIEHTFGALDLRPF